VARETKMTNDTRGRDSGGLRTAGALALVVAGVLTGCGLTPVVHDQPVTIPPVGTCAGGPPACESGLVASCVPLDAYPGAKCRYLPPGNGLAGAARPQTTIVLCGWKCSANGRNGSTAFVAL
jgi:hypothetical protein